MVARNDPPPGVGGASFCQTPNYDKGALLRKLPHARCSFLSSMDCIAASVVECVYVATASLSGVNSTQIFANCLKRNKEKPERKPIVNVKGLERMANRVKTDHYSRF